MAAKRGLSPSVLRRLLAERRTGQSVWRFLEDRRLTLEEVLETPGLEQVSCLLVSWGYLLPEDKDHLPARIGLLNPETLAKPLDDWP